MKAFTVLVAVWLALVVAVAGVSAQDSPPQDQSDGEHSTITVSDGQGGTTSVRDDELAGMIADAIRNSGNTPSSVKVFFNSCYGGGMLDDIADALGTPNFDPPIPFVGASASSADQPAWGPNDGWVGGSSMGSFWTDEFVRALGNASPGDNVSGTIGTANANDPTAAGGAHVPLMPAGGVPETPQNTSAHTGSNVTWGNAAESVVFSGNNSDQRHDNNVSNVEDQFLETFDDAGSNVRSTGSGADPTRNELQSMLNGACNDLAADGSEELVIYIDDHGDTEFDFWEWWGATASQQIIIDPVTGWDSIYDLSEGGLGEFTHLHDGWEQGLRLNEAQGDTVAPFLRMTVGEIDEPIPPDSFFDVFLNDVPLDVPSVVLDTGTELVIPLGPSWGPALLNDPSGPDILQFVPIAGGPLSPVPLGALELCSGPINDIEIVPEPGSLALLMLGLILLRRRR